MDVKIETFPTEKISNVTPSLQEKWLIENIWLESACGIIGGQPKCCKSWLGLDMAVSVASGTSCLGRFPVMNKGPVLVFMAEDRAFEVRQRVEGIAHVRGINLCNLDLHLINVPTIRLDLELDQRRLDATIAAVSPRIVLLDPLVRLHRLDENSARDISGLLDFFRYLERRYKTAIVLTHHSSKKRAARPGQSLRGTSDLHAFGDSNIYLSRKGKIIEISLEHRSAAAIEPFSVHLSLEDEAHLQIIQKTGENKPTEDLSTRILTYMKKFNAPISRQGLRDALKVNNQSLGKLINTLISQEKIAIKNHNIILL